MAQARAERPSFTFNKGLNTDAPLVTFPPDYSTDELNFELLLDGTRRRRRGLAQETTDVILDVDQPSDAIVRTFKWRSVGGNPDLNFHVWQVGTTLYFANDVAAPSDSLRNFTLDLVGLAVPGFEDQIFDQPVDMSFGRGHAVLVGKYIEPTLIIYDADQDDLDVSPIPIRERDFQGVEDGFDNTTHPTTATDPFIYNLVNQGWIYGNVLTYFTSEGNYPSKNMLQWLGYRRELVPGFAEVDGTRQFSPDKLVEELFQDARAPAGHFIQNPFDTTVNVIVQTETIQNFVTFIDPNKPDPSVGFTLPPHGGGATVSNLITIGFENPHFLNVGNSFDLLTNANGRIGSYTGDGNRFWNVVAPSGNTKVVEEVVSSTHIKIYVSVTDDGPGYRPGWIGAGWPGLYAYVGGTVINIEGRIIDERPTATAFFAGRAWYAGVPHPDLGSAIYFSQIVEVDAQYGKCYQVADPTDENISDLVATDGGVLRIPEVGRVFRLIPFSSSLVVFASGGIWEIGPGANGYFTADSYSIRKLSDVGCVSGASALQAESVLCYWGTSGILAVVQDTNTGYLTAQSITINLIDNFYSDIGETARKTSTGDFDRFNKRLIWVYTEDSVQKALVFDTRFNAFTPWAFECQVGDIFTTTDPDTTTRSTVRFIAYNASGFQIVTPSSLAFTDLGAAITAYIVTGFDTAQSPTRYKYAPIITTFMKRTEILTLSSTTFIPEFDSVLDGADVTAYAIESVGLDFGVSGALGTLTSNGSGFDIAGILFLVFDESNNGFYLVLGQNGSSLPGDDFETVTILGDDEGEPFVVTILQYVDADIEIVTYDGLDYSLFIWGGSLADFNITAGETYELRFE